MSYDYTGRRDGTGLLYYGARYYDPVLGRFLSPDTLGTNASNPQSLNRYSYVLNNPLIHTDPTGHCVEDGSCDRDPTDPADGAYAGGSGGGDGGGWGDGGGGGGWGDGGGGWGDGWDNEGRGGDGWGDGWGNDGGGGDGSGGGEAAFADLVHTIDEIGGGGSVTAQSIFTPGGPGGENSQAVAEAFLRRTDPATGRTYVEGGWVDSTYIYSSGLALPLNIGNPLTEFDLYNVNTGEFYQIKPSGDYNGAVTQVGIGVKAGYTASTTLQTGGTTFRVDETGAIVQINYYPGKEPYPSTQIRPGVILYTDQQYRPPPSLPIYIRVPEDQPAPQQNRPRPIPIPWPA